MCRDPVGQWISLLGQTKLAYRIRSIPQSDWTRGSYTAAFATRSRVSVVTESELKGVFIPLLIASVSTESDSFGPLLTARY